LTLLAETLEYLSGELRKGERPSGQQIAAHLEGVFAALPAGAERCYARADSGMAMRRWKRMRSTDAGWWWRRRRRPAGWRSCKAHAGRARPADGQCEFRYQPEGWGKAYRLVALRYVKKPKPKKKRKGVAEPDPY